MQDIFLLLGSNLGHRQAYLTEAVQLIELNIAPVLKQSSYYETAAWGKEDQPAFINQAISLRSSVSPLKLLQAIWSIEGKLERKRDERWGARTIDIDILFYGNEIINLPELVVPHKLLQQRRFVLMPLHEIAPELIHPVFKKTIDQLLQELSDGLSVQKIENNI